MKKVAMIAVVLVAAGAVFAIYQARHGADAIPGDGSPGQPPAPMPDAESRPAATHLPGGIQAETNTAQRVLVYYFHRTIRCPACLTIERLTREAVDVLRGELPEASFVLQVLNLDEPRNEHFVADFDLTFSTVVIAEEIQGGIQSWTNLSEQVWSLHTDEASCAEYLKAEIGIRAGR